MWGLEALDHQRWLRKAQLSPALVNKSRFTMNDLSSRSSKSMTETIVGADFTLHNATAWE